ncbi:MAG: hypothetical protein LBS31_00315, partial [Candidatus Adiutrix sp.]|nr:hypothetical protein [Candidatus Adiutrix sp.]
MRKIAGPELPLFCALIIFFALVPGCRDETPQAGPVGAKAAAEAVGAPAANQGAPISEGSALEILQCGPAGQVKKLNQVAVMFNQPMTALGDYKNVPPGALVIAPALAGETRWLNQYTLAFAPETPLTGSHVLNVSVASGLTALSGAVLAEGANFEVRLPALGVERAYLLDAETADAAGALRPSWRVTFNQAVDLGSLEAFFEYEEAGAGKKTAAEVVPFQNERGADEFSFDFSASEALPKNTEYSLTLAAGAKSLAGPLPAAELNLGQGRTYGPLTAAIQDVSVDPAYGVYLDFSNPVRLKEVLPLIRINNGYDLTALMKAYAGDDEAAADGLDEYDRDEPRNYIYIPGGFKAQLDYAVAFEAGVKDIYGQELRPGTEVKFVTGEYSPFVRLDGNLGILETATEPKLGLTVRNLDEVEVLGYALEAETAVRFLSAANASPWYFYFNGEAMKELADVRPARLALRPPGGAKDGAALLPLDLARLFGDKLHGRLLYVRSNWKKGSSNGFDNTLIQITDIGLALKVGPASSLLWITNMPKGSAWAGAEAELRGPDGTLLWQGLSDENGLARMPGAQELAEKAPGARNFFVTARAEGQMALWNVNWNDGLEPWRWNINYADHFAAAADDHWLLSALPIYRPGETARFKIIARQNQGDQLLDLAGQEMEVEIRDGRGRVVDGGRVETNPFGTVDYETAIPADAALGDWVVNMARPGGEMRYVGGFGVYAYRAPAFEIKLEGLPREAVAGEKVAVTGRAAYHFGAPAAAQPVRYAVMTKRAHFSLPGAPDYHITSDFRPNDDYDDSDYGYYEPSVTVLSGQGFLAADGTVDIAVDLTPAADLKPAPRTYETHVVVEDVDRRTVAVEAGFLVHPAKIYAGLLSENFLAEAGRPHKVKVIAADIAGRLVPGREVNVTLYRRVWQSVRRKSAGSAYEYVSRVVDQEISKAVATTGELPVELELTPDKPGYYVALAEVKDDDGRLNQASCDFYVSGDGPVGWRMRNDDRLSLVADKKEHQPGDVARIMVQSPFDSGEGLLTIERAGVREARVFKIENQTPTFEVPISEDDAPNVFVSVLLARGRVADKPDRDGLDLGKPAVRLGYVELKIPSKKDLLTVEVKTDHEEVGPGDEVEVTVSVSNHRGDRTAEAEVALIAADAAVIQLAGDHNYYPDRQYHRDRPLTVQTAANLTSLIGRRNWGLKGANPGGGGGESGSRLDDGVRRLFAALAYFNPAVTLDENGEARVKIRMPENLTTFKIYAVATGHGRLSGTGQSSVLVTRDLLARSALPGYAGVGDEFTASMVV